MSDIYLAFWGKAQPATDAQTSWHPVAYHCLDVAAAAMVLLEGRVTHLPELWRSGDAVPGLCALISLHDIGKFTRPFQFKAVQHWPVVLGPAMPSPEIPHDFAGYALLNSGELAEPIDPWLAGWKVFETNLLINAVCGHHGRPVDTATFTDETAQACPICHDAAAMFVADVMALFDPAPLPLLARNGSPEVIWWLAGLTVLADWIGSSQRWFAYHPPNLKLADYWRDVALPSARRAVTRAGLLPCAPRESLSLSELLGSVAIPSPVQALASSVDLEGNAPALILVEDQTGSGKTEAALLLAHRLMAKGFADGVFVALPTMATANGMYSRLADAYRRLFADGATPSLVLTHGRSRDHQAFQDSILLDAAYGGSRPNDPADEPASAQCAAWLADDRRRGFFAAIAVGTIDQALLAVLPTRHAPLRLHGLHRKVLLIDEAHAYDAYMAEEMMRLVQFHAGMGGSTIILSATLPQSIRQRLLAAYGRGRGLQPVVPDISDYPLVTTQQGVRLREIPCAGREGLARRLHVERLPDVEQASKRVAQAARDGLAVAWIRNAVDDAVEAHAALQEDDIPATLFHARFAMGDRMAIEQAVLARFGKHSVSRAGVVVSTQVIEQSLDLDFDLIVTDLAPMDLLIQRAGRLWRHQRERPDRVAQRPVLCVLSPEPVPDPASDWLGADLRRTGYVYADHALLWRTARLLFETGEIVAPGDIRRLVEAAYAADEELPSGLQRRAVQAEGIRSSHVSLARQNLLEWNKPYASNSGEWGSEVATPTRLGEQSRIFRLARWDGTTLRPWCGDAQARRAWALSEIQLSERKATGVPPTSGELAHQERAVRAGWGAWEAEIPILVLSDHAGEWKGEVLQGDKARRCRYSSTGGLEMI